MTHLFESFVAFLRGILEVSLLWLQKQSIVLHNTYFFKKIHIFTPMNVKLKFLLNIFIDYYFEHLAVQLKKKRLTVCETGKQRCLLVSV